MTVTTSFDGTMFQPLTGLEEQTWLEEKFGNVVDEDSQPNCLQSPPLKCSHSLGKVSDWKIRSPAKCQAPAVHMKPTVVFGGLPRKRISPKNRKISCLKKTNTCNRNSPSTEISLVSLEKMKTLSSTTQGEKEDKFTPAAKNPHVWHDDHFGDLGLDDLEKPKFTFPPPSDKEPFLLNEQDDKVKIPATLNQYLRDYQREGISFLYSHYVNNQGAILGDDMGLGKTVQVIGFLSALLGKQGNRVDVMNLKPHFIRMMSDTSGLEASRNLHPFLIIGPGCVLYNWLEELDTWGYFAVRKYHGADKSACLTDVAHGKVEVVVTTFETFRDNLEILNAIDWEAVIVDEVHRIKGLKAQTTRALRSLRCLRRYGLTGTALQNNISELWCILDWAQPGCLGSAEMFENEFVKPMEKGQKHDATKRELAEARKKKEKFANIRNRLMLRRTKKVIAGQLPTKTDRVVFCRLTPMQISVYKAILSHPDMIHIMKLDDQCECGSGKVRGKCCHVKFADGRKMTSVMFTFMHLLLKAANHTALLLPYPRTSPKQMQKSQQLCDIIFKEHQEFVNLTREAAFRTLSDPKYCGKMKVLHGMLSVFAKTRCKVLIFSYSTRLLDILEQHIMSEGHEYRRIDGNVSGRHRQEIVREFNTDPNIYLCLISTKAGGLGLNLTGANKVVIFDPNWNPSLDLQAQDRAYRIGQRRDVEVFRLISAGTIEENVYLRQIYKQQLDNIAIATENARRYFHGIQGDKLNRGELFGIKNMFQLRTGDSCLTMDILHRNAKIEAGIAGYDVANYIPSHHEVEAAMGDNSSAEEDDKGINAEVDSSDDESPDVFRDLFSPVTVESQSKKDYSAEPQHRMELSLPCALKDLNKGKASAPPLPEKSTNASDSADGQKPCTHQKHIKSHTNTHWQSSHEPVSCVQKIPSAVSSGEEEDELYCREMKIRKQLKPENRGSRQKSHRLGKSNDSLTVASSRRRKRKNQLIVEEEESRQKSPRLMSSHDDSISVSSCNGRKRKTQVNAQDDGSRQKSPSVITPSFSSLTTVFEHCGVIHMHDNPQVVGASKIEDHMSRCALQEVFELQINTQIPALVCDPLSQPSEEEQSTCSKRKKKKSNRRTQDHNSPRTIKHGHWHILVGQTPSAIQRQHWTQLKEMMSCATDVALAERVTAASSEKRLHMLGALYKQCHKNGLDKLLDDIFTVHCQPSAGCSGNQTKRSTKTSNSSNRSEKKGGKKTVKKSTGNKTRIKAVTKGLVYDDSTQSQSSLLQNSFICSNDFDSKSKLELGLNFTPKKGKTSTKNTSHTGSRHQQGSKFQAPGFHTHDAQKKRSDIADEETDYLCGIGGVEDVEGLLIEMGQHSSQRQITNQEKNSLSNVNQTPFYKDVSVKANKLDSKLTVSVLDNVFSDSDEDNRKKRKPPPLKSKLIAGKAKPMHNTPKSARSADIFSALMNDSTLCNDEIDCFGEPSPWKKKSKVKKMPARLTSPLEENSGPLQKSDHVLKSVRNNLCARNKISASEEHKGYSSGLNPSTSLFS